MSAPQSAPQLSTPAAPPPVAGGGHTYAPFLTLVAMSTTVLTLVMIVVGSLVTNTFAGDTIPTWPFYNETPEGKAVYEWTHRVIGAILGLAAIGLVVALYMYESRRWVRRMGVYALAAIIAQGLLGAKRVWLVSLGGAEYNDLSRIVVTMIHATVAPAIFGLLALVTLATTETWLNPPPSAGSPDTRRTRRLCILTTVFTFVQIVLGTCVRHTIGLPVEREIAVWIHLAVAGIVAIHVVLMSVRISNKHNAVFPMRQTAGLAVFFVFMQVFLGLGAWLMTPVGVNEVGTAPESLTGLIRTGHVATGAMILAMCLVVTARSFHLLATTPAGAADAATQSAEPATGGTLHREAHA